MVGDTGPSESLGEFRGGAGDRGLERLGVEQQDGVQPPLQAELYHLAVGVLDTRYGNAGQSSMVAEEKSLQFALHDEHWTVGWSVCNIDVTSPTGQAAVTQTAASSRKGTTLQGDDVPVLEVGDEEPPGSERHDRCGRVLVRDSKPVPGQRVRVAYGLAEQLPQRFTGY